MSINDTLQNIHNNNIYVRKRQLFIMDREKEEGDSIGTHQAEEFIKNLILLESVSSERITIHQMTNGGSLSAGLAIFDMIVNSPCEFNFICHGSACSMGAILPQACVLKKDSYRFIYPSCCFMIHEVSTCFGDNCNQKQQKAILKYTTDYTDYIVDILAKAASKGNVYKNKSHKDIVGYIKMKMDLYQDWYLTPEEAVEHGFVDCIIGTPAATEILNKTRKKTDEIHRVSDKQTRKRR